MANNHEFATTTNINTNKNIDIYLATMTGAFRTNTLNKTTKVSVMLIAILSIICCQLSVASQSNSKIIDSDNLNSLSRVKRSNSFGSFKLYDQNFDYNPELSGQIPKMLDLDKQDFGSAFFYPDSNSQQYRNSFGYSDSKPSAVVVELNDQQNNNQDLQNSYSLVSNDKGLGDMFIYEPNAVVDEKSPSKNQNFDFLSLNSNEFEPNKQSDLRYSDLRSQSASTNNENSGDGNEYARVEEIDRNSNGRAANRVPSLDGYINSSEDMNGIETIKPQVSTSSSSSSINSQAAKRQTAGIVASALRNLALGLSDQFNNALGLVTKQDKTTSQVNKDNKTDQINNPNSKNSNNESLVSIQSQPIKAQNKRQLSNTENNNKWSKLRNSEKPSVSLGSNKDELYQTDGIDDSEDDEQRQASGESKLVGKYLYAPTNHFHFALKPGKSVDENDNDVYDDEDVQQSSSRLLATQKLLPKSYASKRLVDETSESGDDGVNDAILSSTSGDKLNSNGGVTRKLLNKVSSNDIYFLVMVVALCASASTIVLAAGFFVYNQQMIKKRADEGEAPTYGLVGPSSLGGSSKNSDNLASNIFVSSTGANNCVIVPKDASSLKASENVKSKQQLQQCNGTILSNGKNENLLIHKFGNPFVTQANSNKEVFLAGQNSATMYHYQHQKQQMITSVSDRASSQQTSASDLDSEDENDEENYTVYECPGLASAHNMEIKNPLFHDDNTPANSPPVVRKK